MDRLVVKFHTNIANRWLFMIDRILFYTSLINQEK